MDATKLETINSGLVLTETAASKVKALIDAEGDASLALRVAVKPGGCAGFQYDLYPDEAKGEDDLVKDFGGLEVIVDQKSANYLVGATIDFEDSIMKQGLTIDNPNATGSCACGNSFN